LAYRPCTALPVFYSTSCEDWTAVQEDSSQWDFKAYTSPFCIKRTVMDFLKIPLSRKDFNTKENREQELFGEASKCRNKKQETRRNIKLNRKNWKGNLLILKMGARKTSPPPGSGLRRSLSPTPSCPRKIIKNWYFAKSDATHE